MTAIVRLEHHVIVYAAIVTGGLPCCKGVIMYKVQK